MMAPIPPADGPALGPWESAKEGMRFLRGHQALQGVYIIDINAMVFGMPRALFPAMAGSVFGGGTITLGFLYAAPGVGALIGAVTTGWVANLKRQGWGVILAVVVWGAAIAVFGLVDTLWVGSGHAGHRRLGRRDLGRAAQHDPADEHPRTASAAGCPPSRWRSSRVVHVWATWSRAPWPPPPASSSRWSPVGLACIAGAVIIGLLMPRFRNHLAVPDEVDDVAV